MARFPTVALTLPSWIEALVPAPDHPLPKIEDRMRVAVDLARRNVEEGTGGPFGAAIFDLERHTLVAPGVNLVVGSGFSGAHAEMMAFAVAQQVLSSHDLGGEGVPPCELVTSVEPCAMCFGATPWSGVRQVVCGARDEDARAIGFDEGPKVEDWAAALESRGIRVIVDVLRADARTVLEDYARGGGPIYNARGGA